MDRGRGTGVTQTWVDKAQRVEGSGGGVGGAVEKAGEQEASAFALGGICPWWWYTGARSVWKRGGSYHQPPTPHV